MANKDQYTASDLRHNTNREQLLSRMNLTFGGEKGGVDKPWSTQKTIAIREIQDNAIDEVLAGHGDRIRVTFHKDDSVEVQDNGRGLPVDIGKDNQGTPVSGIYLSLGIIQAGAKFSKDANRFTTGLNGVGASSTVHLSKRTDVTVYRGAFKYELSFKDGTPGFFKGDGPEAPFSPLADLTKLRKTRDNRPASEKKLFKTGTTVRTWLRPDVFVSPYGIDVDDLIVRLKGTAHLSSVMTIEVRNEHSVFKDPETGKEIVSEQVFHYEDGMAELVEEKQTKDRIGDIVRVSCETSFQENDIAGGKITKRLPIEIVASWDDGYETSVDSFVNTIKTELGGVHEAAFETALVKVFNEKIRSMRGILPKDVTPTFEDYKEGLTAVISIKVSEPKFSSQVKEQLDGDELKRAATKEIALQLEKWVSSAKNSETVRAVGAKISAAAKARQDARSARLAKRRASAASSSGMPAKLSDCAIVGEEESELLICEGDSAKGTIVKARDATYQAVIPIRGKILNPYKATLSSIMANAEITGIGKALGAGFGDSFDTDKLRYGKVILAADADHDGAHINNLLYGIFHKLFRPVIEEGRLYQAVPPLFEVTVGKGRNTKVYYVENQYELERLRKGLDKKGMSYKIERNKGLGEMEPEAFNETVLNPKTRTLRRVTLSDIKAAEETLELVWGKDSQPRKDFMGENYNVAIESGLVDGFDSDFLADIENTDE